MKKLKIFTLAVIFSIKIYAQDPVLIHSPSAWGSIENLVMKDYFNAAGYKVIDKPGGGFYIELPHTTNLIRVQEGFDTTLRPSRYSLQQFFGQGSHCDSSCNQGIRAPVGQYWTTSGSPHDNWASRRYDGSVRLHAPLLNLAKAGPLVLDQEMLYFGSSRRGDFSLVIQPDGPDIPYYILQAWADDYESFNFNTGDSDLPTKRYSRLSEYMDDGLYSDYSKKDINRFRMRDRGLERKGGPSPRGQAPLSRFLPRTQTDCCKSTAQTCTGYRGLGGINPDAVMTGVGGIAMSPMLASEAQQSLNEGQVLKGSIEAAGATFTFYGGTAIVTGELSAAGVGGTGMAGVSTAAGTLAIPATAAVGGATMAGYGTYQCFRNSPSNGYIPAQYDEVPGQPVRNFFRSYWANFSDLYLGTAEFQN